MSAKSRQRRQNGRLRGKQRAVKKEAKLIARGPAAPASNAKGSSDRRRRNTKAFTIDVSRRWYAARMITGMRTKACEALKKIGVTTFVARASATVERRAGRVVRHTPLIPGVVFVGLPSARTVEDVLGQDGVAGVLSYPVDPDEPQGNVAAIVNRPARLDVPSLQRFVDALALGEIERPAGIKEGDNVILRTGPLANWPGIVETILPNERLKVGVSIFGKATPTEVGIAEVQVV